MENIPRMVIRKYRGFGPAARARLFSRADLWRMDH
jgi:hypothetical protein